MKKIRCSSKKIIISSYIFTILVSIVAVQGFFNNYAESLSENRDYNLTTSGSIQNSENYIVGEYAMMSNDNKNFEYQLGDKLSNISLSNSSNPRTDNNNAVNNNLTTNENILKYDFNGYWKEKTDFGVADVTFVQKGKTLLLHEPKPAGYLDEVSLKGNVSENKIEGDLQVYTDNDNPFWVPFVLDIISNTELIGHWTHQNNTYPISFTKKYDSNYDLTISDQLTTNSEFQNGTIASFPGSIDSGDRRHMKV